MASLAEYLGVRAPCPVDEDPKEENPQWLADIKDPKEFCRRILESYEFRQYIFIGLKLGTLPPAVLARVMDHAMGKPPERVEHTGKDGAPIETITEVRRVIVRGSLEQDALPVVDRVH